MWSRVWSGCVNGLNAHLVKVEADLQSGLPSFAIVGLPDTSIRESKERVRSALKNGNFSFPMKRITVNLAPAHVKKEGSSFDLALALVLLMADQQWNNEKFKKTLFLGELSLQGELNPIRGVLPLVMEAKRQGFESIFVPIPNAREAAMEKGVAVYGIKNLLEAVQFLKGEITIPETILQFPQGSKTPTTNFSEVKGQKWAKRALTIAAAGGHHLLMIGSPGCGKSMLARRLPTILPPLSFDESLETTRLYSISGLLKEKSLILNRPFRHPHHTISYSALVGGGVRVAMPGEVSLAHKGVLFLDEMAEFRKDVLEVLREPLEQKEILISRSGGKFRYPADFMLVGAMNPCPCGHHGDPKRECVCTFGQMKRYQRKISGPLLDRIDIHLFLPKISLKDISETDVESSESMLERVLRAREIQSHRFKQLRITLNAQMSPTSIERFCHLASGVKKYLDQAMEHYGFSYRTYHRILKLARTLADVAGEEKIRQGDVAEAMQLRSLDHEDLAN